MSTIHTEYDVDRGWTAVFDGYDGGMIDNETPSDDLIGYGNTELESISDLLDKQTESNWENS